MWKRQLKQIAKSIRFTCGECVFFHTEKCTFFRKTDSISLIQASDSPCIDGLCFLIIGTNCILSKGKTQLIKPLKYLSSEKTKNQIAREFELDFEDVEALIIGIMQRKQHAKDQTEQKPEEEKPEFLSEYREKAEALLREPDILEKFIQHSNTWLVEDQPTRKIELLTCISALGDYPLNLALMQSFSTGKTRTIVATAKYFEDNQESVWLVGRLSPTALIHEKGEYDKEKDLFKIDLRNRIIIALDELPYQTLEMLKPLLSRDRYEIMYRITHKEKMQTIATVLKGFPVCIFCAVRSRYTMEFCSRWLTASPQINPEKIRKVITQKSDMAQHPEKYREDEEFQIWRKAFNLLKEGTPYTVIIPFASIIGKNFRAQKPTDMRFYDLFLALLKASTVLHAYQRQKDKGKLIASKEDYEIAYNIFQTIEKPTLYGIGENVLSFYNDIVLPLADGNLSYATYETLMQRYNGIYGEPISRTQVRDEYLKPLERTGLIDIQDHPSDKRAKAIYSVGTLKEVSLLNDEEIKNNIAKNEGRESIV